MAMPVTLAGSLPGEPTNGLIPAAKDLIADPKRLRLVIGVVDVMKITAKTDNGDIYPTVRVRHIELVTEADAHAARELLGRALAGRTGEQQLAFEPGEQAPVGEPPPDDDED